MKTLGILSGMGPETGAYFLQQFTALHHSAKRDQDHPPVILFSNTQVPCRVQALIAQGPTPVPEIVRSLQQLERMGADFAIILCNTAHAYFDTIQSHVNIPLFNLVQHACEMIEQRFTPMRAINNTHNKENKGQSKVMLLGTTGTVHSHVYQDHSRSRNYELTQPKDSIQEQLNELIFNTDFGLKSSPGRITSKAEDLLHTILHHLPEEAHYDHLLAGCTEISIALRQLNVRCLDPLFFAIEGCLDICKDVYPIDSA
ncbi:aspartate/glutamate racemase family protein [Algicola sagamiensis]|uniref:aspartate/glutamate racemase family protein n=1 Tax=Algicola sagamiensis TaxID=163869 RepID=UPI000362D0FA|nr:amino acid racemase [Algicola sagamiensis]